MFKRRKVAFSPEHWARIDAYSQAAGYATPEEFVMHAVEKALAEIEEADSDEAVRERLKGLGYLG